MSGDNLYLLSALPGLGYLGSMPPMTVTRLLEQVVASEGDRDVLEALLLSDDLLQRQAYLSGETDQVEPAVLTLAQLQGKESLPTLLDVPSEEDALSSSGDILWESYFRYASSVADAQNSDFLRS